MVGPRTKIVFLSLFFTFAFALLFLALVQNYARAETFVSDPVFTPSTSDIHPVFGIGISSLPDFDFDSDDSFQKYLNADHPFLDTSYTPNDLIHIESDFTANNSRAFELRQEAATQFADMARHFRNTFSWDRLYITSTYRSKWFQDFLVKQWCSLLKCAKVWTSEHQAWLALDLKVITRWGRWISFDITDKPNKYYDWLKTNAAEFGFHNTYQRGIEIDGKIAEWRHRRYVGKELATILMNNNQTFAEYYNSTNN